MKNLVCEKCMTINSFETIIMTNGNESTTSCKCIHCGHIQEDQILEDNVIGEIIKIEGQLITEG